MIVTSNISDSLFLKLYRYFIALFYVSCAIQFFSETQKMLFLEKIFTGYAYFCLLIAFFSVSPTIVILKNKLFIEKVTLICMTSLTLIFYLLLFFCIANDASLSQFLISFVFTEITFLPILYLIWKIENGTK